MTGKFLFFISMAAAPLLGLPASAATTSQNVDITVTNAAPPLGPLRVLASNPRYFATPDGKAVYLTGNHTWTSGLMFTRAGPFSFAAMVDYMQTLNVNLIRHWDVWVNMVDPTYGAVTSPVPFNRSGVCCANDGGNKFDLTSFNPTFFNNLKENVEYAASKGAYIMPLLFNLIEYDRSGFTSWSTDYWNGSNNINGTTTDYQAAVTGANSTTLSLMQSYLRRFLDTLANEPNVLYEVANELDHNDQVAGVYAFQEGVVNLVHSYEVSQGYMRHPVGVEYPMGVSASPADFIIPYLWHGNVGVFSFGKPAIIDTDHWWGIGGGTSWWWQGFMNGNLMISMDDMEFTGLSGNLSLASDPFYGPYVPAMVQNRAAIQQTRTVATMVDMTGMVPRGDLCSTGLGLADTSKHMYIIYASGGGSVTVNLSSDSGVPLKARWLSTADGTLSGTMDVTGGSHGQAFISPFGGTPAALVIIP